MNNTNDTFLNTENNAEVSLDSNSNINEDSQQLNNFKLEQSVPFKFSIGLPDVIFIITSSKEAFKCDTTNLVGKIFIPRDMFEVDLNELSNILSFMNIDKLNIFSINEFSKKQSINIVKVNEKCEVNYIEIGVDDFISHLDNLEIDFLEYNKNTLYILRDGNYMDAKTIFTKIGGYNVHIGRGGSQKAHMVSPLDFRLSCYLMAMFNFDYKLISYYNTFNDIQKYRYLPFIEKTNKSKTIVKNNSLDRKLVSNSSLLSNNLNLFSFLKNRKDVKQFHTSSVWRSNIKKEISIFSYLDQIDNIIKNTNSFFDAQKEIERSWLSLMKAKLEDPNISTWKILPQLIKNGVNTLEKHGKRGILNRRFKLFSSEILCNKEEIILLTMAMLVSSYNRTGATNLSIQIGSSISFLLFKEQLAIDREKAKSKFKDLDKLDEEFNMLDVRKKFEQWKISKDLNSNTKLLKLGDYFINIFTNEPTQIFEFGLDEDDIMDTTSERIIKISPEYVESIKDSLFVHPTSLPMLCEPLEWSDHSYGGFLENRYNQDPINTGSSYHGHTILQKESLYKAVNSLNKTAFNVNNELLEYILNEGSYLLESTDNKKRDFQHSITLKVASIYSKYKFYLNLNSDWRGRLYTNSFFLTYQGGDLSRSLIEFAEGNKLSEKGLKYLYIYGANCYSDVLGKKSITQRITWVKKNLDKIISLDKDFILKASKKIQFTAFCLALKNYELDHNYLIKLPVFLDATCSGIQHLAAMLQDINLGTHVNLIRKSEDDQVGDLYQTVVEPINKAINKFGRENSIHSSLSNVMLDRKILKTSIMTQVYAVKVDGIYRQLISKFKKKIVVDKINKTKTGKDRYNTYYLVPGKNGLDILVPYIDVYKMAEIINKESFNIYPSLKEIYNYFIDSVKIMLNLKLPVVWFTPAGLEITQFYYQSDIKKVKLSYFGKTRTSVLRDWKPIVNKSKQNQAIIPNIIHSLDASHLINVINTGYLSNITPIISVHDCFGTHPNKMDDLAKIIRSEFALLYTENNFLEKYNERLINTIIDNNYEIREKDGKKYVPLKRKLLQIPDVPKKGELDMKEIINAKYLVN